MMALQDVPMADPIKPDDPLAAPPLEVRPLLRLAADLAGAAGADLVAEADVVGRFAVALPGQPWVLVLDGPARSPERATAMIEPLVAQLALSDRLRGLERELSTELALIQRTSGVGSWIWDLSSGRITWSEKLFYLLGIDPDQADAGMSTVLDRVVPHDRRRLLAAIDDARRGGGYFVVDHAVERLDGSRRAMSTSGRVVVGADGQSQRVILTMQDVTERLEMAQELEAARRRAEASAEAKARFLAQMSHEIRTPLNAVLGFSGLLAQGPLDERQRRYVGIVLDTGRMLLSMVNDLLDLSKLEAGKISIERIPFALGPILESARATTEVLLAEKDVAFTLDRAADAPEWMLGDPTRIRQVLTNFLGNAGKFTARGAIELRVRVPAMSADRATLRLEVEDTGIGIPRGRQPALFRRFSQVSDETTRLFGGTGLGLAICRELAELMGGRVGVSSEPGIGSTFWIELDLAVTTAPHDDGDRPAAAIDAQSLHVLVVDDVETNRELAQALIEAAGHRVTTAADGLAAITAIQDELPDVVLMDVNMPRLDGLEATRAVRRLSRPFRDLPILAMTANAFPIDLETCRLAGMNGHIVKPIDPATMFAAIARAVEGVPRSRRRAPATTTGASRAIDRERLEMLRGQIGAAALLSLFRRMTARARAEVVVMEKAVAVGDAQGLRDAAHKLAGLCGSLGAGPMSQVASKLEAAADSAGLAAAGMLLREMGSLIEQSDAEFESWAAAPRPCAA